MADWDGVLEKDENVLAHYEAPNLEALENKKEKYNKWAGRVGAGLGAANAHLKNQPRIGESENQAFNREMKEKEKIQEQQSKRESALKQTLAAKSEVGNAFVITNKRAFIFDSALGSIAWEVLFDTDLFKRIFGEKSTVLAQRSAENKNAFVGKGFMEKMRYSSSQEYKDKQAAFNEAQDNPTYVLRGIKKDKPMLKEERIIIDSTAYYPKDSDKKRAYKEDRPFSLTFDSTHDLDSIVNALTPFAAKLNGVEPQ